MSYSGALRDLTSGGESESHIVIDACLARVRVDAHLDEEPVLPPLEVIVGARSPIPFPSARVAPISEVIRRREPDSGVRLYVEAPVPTADVIAAECVPLARRRRSRTAELVQRMRWPVLLCGFLAGTFGGVALMKSPVGQRPGVQRVVKATSAHATSITAAAKARLAL